MLALSDVMPTGHHAAVSAGVKKGDVVAVVGDGAVGLCAVLASGAGNEVHFANAAPETNQQIDSAYHAKYDRYGPGIVGHVTGPAAHAVTIRLIKAVR
jgi:threonine dehydrogenase-like Zn-dependent dehydrogenase